MSLLCKKVFAKIDGGWEFKLHLEETEASRVEAVFPFPILQREELYQLVNKLRVREIFKDDLFALGDTQTNTTCNNTEAPERDTFSSVIQCEHAPRSSLRTASHLLASQKLHGSSFL